MKSNNIKMLVFSLVVITVIGIIVTGSTFAYFQWTTSEDQRTNVEVTIEHGSIVMTISPEQTSFSGLRPTNNCVANAAYGDALVKVENGTGTIAIPSFKLKVRVEKGGSDTLTKAALSHINYSVVPIETTVDANGNPVKGSTGSYNCANTPSGTDDDGGGLFTNVSIDSWTTHLYLDSVATDGSWTHIPKRNDKVGYYGESDESPNYTLSSEYLPRQYYIEDSAGDASKGDVAGITFKAGPGGTTYQYFRVYVWIDSRYTATTVGNVISDPLQNAKIFVTWSEESMIQQVEGIYTPGDNYVAGSGSGAGTTLAAGLYDENGEILYTWKDLTDDGDIVVEDGTITYSTHELSGKLIIPEGITEIGDGVFSYAEQLTSVVIPNSVTTIGVSAFDGSAINEIIFGENSKLTTIGEYAFVNIMAEKIKLPDSVTTIGEYAFAIGTLTEVTFGENSKLTTIGPYAFAYANLSSVTIPVSLTFMGMAAFTDNYSLSTVNYQGTVARWNEINFEEDLRYTFGNTMATEIVCSNGRVPIN